jgi:putative peptidoglycan lipid II flippase
VGTSLNGCLNAWLLFRRLRKDDIYRPLPGWQGFGLRLFLANALMALAVYLVAGDISAWQAAAIDGRLLKLVAVLGVAGPVYFGVLFAAGLRPRHLRPAKSQVLP